jgi:hypothetical protein
MKKKCDTARRRDNVDRRRGDTGEGKRGDDVSSVDANLTRPKIKKIYAVDSVATKWTVKI